MLKVTHEDAEPGPSGGEGESRSADGAPKPPAGKEWTAGALGDAVRDGGKVRLKATVGGDCDCDLCIFFEQSVWFGAVAAKWHDAPKVALKR